MGPAVGAAVDGVGGVKHVRRAPGSGAASATSAPSTRSSARRRSSSPSAHRTQQYDVAHACAGFAGSCLRWDTRSRRSARRRSPRFSRGSSSTAAWSAGRRPSPEATLSVRASTPTRWRRSSPARRSATRIVSSASAVKMAYAAWSRGETAMLLAIREVARANEGRSTAHRPQHAALPAVPQGRRRAGNGSARWRRSPDTFDAAGQPDGFHRAAAEVFRASIRASGLSKRFGDTRVLSGVDLDLTDGLLLVTGPNGSGKTTLLRILARLARRRQAP